MPVALQEAGYDTIHIGKYLNGYGRDSTEVPPGWTDFHGSIDPSTYLYFNFSLNVNGRTHTYGTRPSNYQTDVYARIAENVITRHRGKEAPFFLSVAFLAPHAEAREGVDEGVSGRAVPAPRHADRFGHGRSRGRRRSTSPMSVTSRRSSRQGPASRPPSARRSRVRYRAGLASLLAVDDAVERIIGALDDDGVLDDTVVIFTSDNGFFHGEHRIPDDKIHLYEPSIRVPLLVRGPGVPVGPLETPWSPTSTWLPPSSTSRGPRPCGSWTVDRWCPTSPRRGADRPRRILLESGTPRAPVRGVRTDRYVYVEHPTGERELYDLDADPDELENRADDPAMAEVRADLAERLDELRTCAGRSCRSS